MTSASEPGDAKLVFFKQNQSLSNLAFHEKHQPLPAVSEMRSDCEPKRSRQLRWFFELPKLQQLSVLNCLLFCVAVFVPIGITGKSMRRGGAQVVVSWKRPLFISHDQLSPAAHLCLSARKAVEKPQFLAFSISD